MEQTPWKVSHGTGERTKRLLTPASHLITIETRAANLHCFLKVLWAVEIIWQLLLSSSCPSYEYSQYAHWITHPFTKG